MEKRVKRTEVPDDLPRSPTGRIPQWVIDEAKGRAVDAEPWRAPGSPEADLQRPVQRRRRSWVWWVAGLVLVAMLASAVASYLR